jgi:Flp pilus assembly pilin Flp
MCFFWTGKMFRSFSAPLKRGRTRRLWRDEKGASMVEYAIIVGLVVTSTIASINIISGKVGSVWTDLDSRWQGPPPPNRPWDGLGPSPDGGGEAVAGAPGGVGEAIVGAPASLGVTEY